MTPQLALTIGLICALTLIAAAIWSLYFPKYRLWPPNQRNYPNQIAVWALTIGIFWSAVVVGADDWNGLEWPNWLRWGVGLPIMLAANIVVSIGMAQIGFRATSGEATGLVRTGLYRLSRNPQYLANIASLIGWQMLCASLASIPVVLAGIAVFIVGSMAEDRWLADRYGADYRQYRETTPHFL